jgi:pyrimidine-nucleoside phosphorylase
LTAALDPRAFLREKRDGREHSPGAIAEFVARAGRDIPDYQVSAWLMAAFVQGLSESETAALTQAMTRSGRVFDWSELGVPAADKHSTGGIGDKISLVLAPLTACCGLCVPMVSGRGLGHTGGTLDKLESIPGFRTALSPEQMRSQLGRLGVFMAGQGPDLAPADGLLYALRDVTSTVESQPFIVSSIVIKKIAEGARAIVYDVKCGSGAFMRTPGQARDLASKLVSATRFMGAASAALITDMSWPIGGAIGNALEVTEALEVLKGEGSEDTRELTLTLVAEMLRLAGAEPDVVRARARAAKALAGGEALDKFIALIEAQGGDARALDGPLHPAPAILDVHAPCDGHLAGCDGFRLGELVVAMGGGRRAASDAIDPRVGLTLLKQRGEVVRRGESFARLHAATQDESLAARAAACFEIDGAPPAARPVDLVMERLP